MDESPRVTSTHRRAPKNGKRYMVAIDQETYSLIQDALKVLQEKDPLGDHPTFAEFVRRATRRECVRVMGTGPVRAARESGRKRARVA